jgi:phosphoglycerol transferase MdoB-like AlkP superfamily enzyme
LNNTSNHLVKKEPLALLWIFIKHYLFWMCFFAFNRLIFIAYNAEEWKTQSFSEVTSSFVSALHLDFSQASYFVVVPFVLMLVYSVTRWNVLMTINSWITYLFIILSTFIYTAEIPIYDEWHTKLNKKAILYLQHPTEVINSATNKELFGGLFLVALIISLSILFYKKWITIKQPLQRFYLYIPVTGILIFPALLVIGIRGGLQQIPIQQSDAYYSKSNFLNLSAVNTIWNLGQSFIENRYDNGSNRYAVYSDSTANALVKELFSVEKDSFPQILTTTKPNVVFVILESWSADLLKSLGGFDSVAPNMEDLIKDGVLFTQMYSSGTLSDQGHCSLLSAFPSQPNTVILRQPDKFQKLPSIVNHFKKNGYYTAYYFGGELVYGNIKGYIYYNQFDRIIEGKDFDKNLPKGKLGYHDQFLFDKVLTETNTFKQPFFTTAFTMSSHSPYDYPGETKYFDWGGDENMYVNGAHYADMCIGDFMRKAKKQPWYNNTLFIFCSDHSHASPKNHNFYDPQNRHIVSFMYGNVIKPEYRGLKVNKMGNHHDIANTLLSQLNGDVKPFVWSKNLLNPYSKDFGFSADEYLIYFYDQQNAYTYRYTDNLFLYKQFKSAEDSTRMLKYGRAYIQVLYQQYLDY